VRAVNTILLFDAPFSGKPSDLPHETPRSGVSGLHFCRSQQFSSKLKVTWQKKKGKISEIRPEEIQILCYCALAVSSHCKWRRR